jgi:hypothetical protein
MDRLDQFKAEGLPPRLAKKIAEAERSARERLVDALGGDLARTARLAISVDGEDVRIFIVAADAELSKAQRRAFRTEHGAFRAQILPA